jgi:hypothetical protein
MARHSPGKGDSKVIAALAAVLWCATGISTFILAVFDFFISMWVTGSAVYGPLLVVLIIVGYLAFFHSRPYFLFAQYDSGWSFTLVWMLAAAGQGHRKLRGRMPGIVGRYHDPICAEGVVLSLFARDDQRTARP